MVVRQLECSAAIGNARCGLFSCSQKDALSELSNPGLVSLFIAKRFTYQRILIGIVVSTRKGAQNHVESSPKMA